MAHKHVDGHTRKFHKLSKLNMFIWEAWISVRGWRLGKSSLVTMNQIHIWFYFWFLFRLWL